AEEVVDALEAGERSELAGRAVEDLGHLGVRLEEGLGRDAEAQAAELLVEHAAARDEVGLAPRRGLRELVGAGDEERLDVERARQRRLVDLAVAEDEAQLQLARAPPLAD